MTLFEAAHLRVEDTPAGIAFLKLAVADRPLNVLHRGVFADLSAALDVLGKTSSLKLLVLLSDKKSGFIAGADLREFSAIRTGEEAWALSQLGQELYTRLEDLPIPSLAVIHGVCLGGGLELALACDYRLAVDLPSTQFALPEIELGIIPGWGATQRLPRVVGLERALQMILGARRVDARTAHAWGLVDGLTNAQEDFAGEPFGPLALALKRGKRLRHGLPLHTWRQRALESTAAGRWLLFRGTERVLRRKTPDDMPGPREALAAVKTGLREGMAAGLAYEREAVSRLMATPAARNLINLFFQREQARKSAGSERTTIQRVGIVGAGTMGAGIAQLAAMKGFEVVIQEANAEALGTGTFKIAALFEQALERRLISEEEFRRKLSCIRGTLTWEGFGNVDLVIEAALEDLPAKQAIFRELEKRTRPEAILATNTSSLRVEQMAQGLKHPERVAGLHFFNPVHKTLLVEVVRASATAEAVLTKLAQWAAGLGKTPVVVQDTPGFVVNRILVPYLNEAVLLVREGLDIEQVDRLMVRFGMPMGPLELLDQIGLDVAAHVARIIQPVYEGRLIPTSSFERMAKRGWLGQKNHLGFYRYQGKRKKPHRAAQADLRKNEPAPTSDYLPKLPPAARLQEARERLVLIMCNEAALCLKEGLASAEMIDLALVLGTGWAPHRGGPLRYAADRGIAKALEELAQRLGPRFAPGL